jgi:hypothetical protein
MVFRDSDGTWQTQLQWQQVVHGARRGSREQRMRWSERWMEKRVGLPGSGGRRAVVRPAWLAAARAAVAPGFDR